MNKTAIIIIVVCGIILLLCNANPAKSHESEQYKHQVGNLHMYGGGEHKTKALTRFYWVNAEHTMCVDAIYSHGLLHVTAPYNCKED